MICRMDFDIFFFNFNFGPYQSRDFERAIVFA